MIKTLLFVLACGLGSMMPAKTVISDPFFAYAPACPTTETLEEGWKAIGDIDEERFKSLGCLPLRPEDEFVITQCYRDIPEFLLERLPYNPLRNADLPGGICEVTVMDRNGGKLYYFTDITVFARSFD